jgi:hypothetical protein
MLGDMPVHKLRQFLRELKPQARALLLRQLERAELQAEQGPSQDPTKANVILRELRRIVRELGEPVPRICSPQRLFFELLAPFVVDTSSDKKEARKYPGRIARSSLDSIWNWLARDLLPDAVRAYSDDVTTAMLADDDRSYTQRVVLFREEVAAAIARMLATTSDDIARGRLVAQIGTPHALAEIKEIHAIFAARDRLTALIDRLPPSIRNLSDDTLNYVRRAVEQTAVDLPIQYPLTIAFHRLEAPWQLVRIAVSAAGSDAAARIMEQPHSAAVTLVLGDIERQVDLLRVGLRTRRGNPAARVKILHDAIRGIRTEIDLPATSPWSRQIMAIRSTISGILRSEMESTSGAVRLLLRPKSADQIAPGATIDETEVAHCMRMVELVAACRPLASELAVGEITARVATDLEQWLHRATQALIEALRTADDRTRPYLRSQVEAAIHFCGPILGEDYSARIAKSADIAKAADAVRENRVRHG